MKRGKRSERELAIMRRNKQLAKVGIRICPTCEKRCKCAAPEFLIGSNGKPTGDCHTCRKLKDAQRKRDRYKHDPEFRKATKEQVKAYRKTPKGRARNQEYQRAWRKRRKIARLWIVSKVVRKEKYGTAA
jgi:hypothetical protein